jgi:hypothetical protein
MPLWDDMRLVGKQHGDVIANYLANRMNAGRITPAQVRGIIATHIDKHSRDMIATGTSPVDLTVWLDGLESAVYHRFPDLAAQECSAIVADE